MSSENEENPWMAHSDMFQSLSFIRILKIQCALHKLKFIFNVECKGGHEAETCYKAKHRSGKSFSAWKTLKRQARERYKECDSAEYDLIKEKKVAHVRSTHFNKKNSINFVHQSNSFSQFFQIFISHKYDKLSEHLYFFENIEPEQSTLCKITFYNSLLHMKIRAAFICCDGVIFAFYTVDN